MGDVALFFMITAYVLFCFTLLELKRVSSMFGRFLAITGPVVCKLTVTCLLGPVIG